MIDFAAARRMMVDGQVRTIDVTDPRLLAAMLELPRERFLPQDKMAFAYLDLDVPVSEPGLPVRRLLKPMVLAKLIQASGVAETDRVLDVGCATGYSTALLSRLAASVVGLEEDANLASQATEALGELGIANAKVVVARSCGCPGEGPYDLILMQGSTEIVPQALMAQLKNGGRLACVLGRGPAAKPCSSHARRGAQRPPDLRCAAPVAGLFASPGVRVLTSSAMRQFYGHEERRDVARAQQRAFFLHNLSQAGVPRRYGAAYDFTNERCWCSFRAPMST